MTKSTRLNDLKETLNKKSHLDDATYLQVMELLQSASEQKGYDKDGLLKVAMFDAKTYDLDAFNQQNLEQDLSKKGQSNTAKVKIIPHATALNKYTAILAKDCKVVCIFVNDKCDKQVIKKLASFGVELIALRCAGFNNVDLQACEKHGIDVVRVPAYSPHAVAEHSVALMLMLNRNLHKAYLRNRTGQFVLDGLVGFDMYKKTVGVMGTGKIGQCTINILRGFGCNILAYDKYPNPELQAKENVDYVSLDEMLERSDIVTLHAPLLDETYHCINADSIAKMKKGVMLINTSRGGLVDAKALIGGLKRGQISAAGLDVYEEEADIFFKDMSNEIVDDDVFARLLSFSNVVITSHQAFLTKEALANIAQTTLSNIADYQQGQRGDELINKVVK